MYSRWLLFFNPQFSYVKQYPQKTKKHCQEAMNRSPSFKMPLEKQISDVTNLTGFSTVCDLNSQNLNFAPFPVELRNSLLWLHLQSKQTRGNCPKSAGFMCNKQSYSSPVCYQLAGANTFWRKHNAKRMVYIFYQHNEDILFINHHLPSHKMFILNISAHFGN